MHEISVTIQACRRAGTSASIAWLVDASAFPDRDAGEAVVFTPGGGQVGAVLDGAADGQLIDASHRRDARLVDVEIGEVEALIAGLSGPGTARCLIASSDDWPPELWDVLTARETAALVIDLDGNQVTAAHAFAAADIDRTTADVQELFFAGRSTVHVTDDRIVAVFVPVPRLLIVGRNRIAEQVATFAEQMPWHVERANEPERARFSVALLGPPDKLLVVGHDEDLAAIALEAGLSSHAGYVGLLGAGAVRARLVTWLADRGFDDTAALHTPAGLDIGATTPTEVAVSVIAEAIGAAPREPGSAIA